MSGMSANLCPFRAFSILEKAKNRGGLSQVNKVDIFVVDFLARNLQPLNASCSGALSWWRIHLSGQSSGLFLQTDICNLVSTSKYTVDSPFVLVQ
jgi:hypothetical protein